MIVFERRLWVLARNYHALAQQAPKTLVDIARIVEMQEQASCWHEILVKHCFVNNMYYIVCWEENCCTKLSNVARLSPHTCRKYSSVRREIRLSGCTALRLP